jgi:hypothetical protein
MAWQEFGPYRIYFGGYLIEMNVWPPKALFNDSVLSVYLFARFPGT